VLSEQEREVTQYMFQFTTQQAAAVTKLAREAAQHTTTNNCKA
jgi:hypothetical protein